MKLRMMPALVWTSLIFAACLIPARWLRVNESAQQLGGMPVDKLVHGTMFVGYGLLWMLAARSRRQQRWVLVSGVLLAVCTELGQAIPFVARDPDLFDASADVVGLILGFGVGMVVSSCLNLGVGSATLTVQPQRSQPEG